MNVFKPISLKEEVHARIKEESETTDLSMATIVTIAFDLYMKNKKESD